MKALFLVALIIACAYAITNPVSYFPSDLLGQWNFASSNGSNCSSTCSYTSVTFSTGAGTTLNMNVTGSCSDTYVLQNTAINETETGYYLTDLTVFDQDGSDWDIFISNLGGLQLSLSQNTSVCTDYFSKSAYLMKATIGAVIAGVIMLI